MKRKGQHSHSPIASKKRRSSPADQQAHSSNVIRHSILKLYYKNVYTLGDVLRDWLPPASRVRRKKLARFDTNFPQHAGFLDKIIIGFHAKPSLEIQSARQDELTAFTQTQRAVKGNSRSNHLCNLNEIIDFAIWSLFRRNTHATKNPSHLLCRGLQRSSMLKQQDDHLHEEPIPGIVERFHNADVAKLRQPPWTDMANLLGNDSGTIILSFFLDCSMFCLLETGRNNLYQFSGDPISQLLPFLTADGKRLHTESGARFTSTAAAPASINFVRNRMFHARPSLTNRGKVQLGLKHVHVLNRCNDLTSAPQDLHVMRYVFPRQFGLHNVFTSKPNPSETVQALKDYTMREEEISRCDKKKMSKIPRRLRGPATDLVRKLRKNHSRCSYSQLLRYYCSVASLGDRHSAMISNTQSSLNDVSQRFVTQSCIRSTEDTQDHQNQDYSTSFIPYSTPVPQVTGFCKAVVLRLLPRNVFGKGNAGDENWTTFLHSIQRFVEMRRFESTSIHDICQGINIKCIHWLHPPLFQPTMGMAESDRTKRWEIFYELVYYLFDSILIPLIRSNFYVTETGIHRNRLFYFRHDVWKTMVDPSLSLLRLSMFEPLNLRQLKHKLGSNSLGCGHMRLVPKAHGVRPIINLKRKTMTIKNGKPVLGTSVNSRLAPVFSVLNLERRRHPEKLASAMFSAGEMQDRLTDFKHRSNSKQRTFFFVKVDIRSCFDSLPQKELLSFILDFLSEDEYQTAKHVELKPRMGIAKPTTTKAAVKYAIRALLTTDNPLLSAEAASHLASNKRSHVFVNVDEERRWRFGNLQKLLSEHLQQNIVRIGHKHFRQLTGIPQGSVLSSLLCNLFYGDFERKELQFLDPCTSLLLRLTDDFLLITTDELQAKKFVEAMSHGDAKYGISVNTDKSLVNFEVSTNGHKMPKVHGTQDFPYLGMLINTHTLQVRKERRDKDVHVENGLSVRRSGRVGALLQSKTLSTLKRQMSGMLLDGSLNSRFQVVTSVFECFVETGMKMHQYLKSLPKSRRPDQAYLVELCKQLTISATKTLHRTRVHRPVQVTKAQMVWLGTAALSKVLSRKQSEYSDILRWLNCAENASRKSMNMTTSEVERVMKDGLRPFEHYVY